MDSYRRGPPQASRGDAPIGGSVRAARDRMADGNQTLESRAFKEPRTAPSPPESVTDSRQNSPRTAPQPPRAQGKIDGGSISRPIAQSPQWPLVQSASPSPERTNSGQAYQPPTNIRPGQAQPNYAPPLFNRSKGPPNYPPPKSRQPPRLSEIEPDFYNDTDNFTPVSRQSTISSVGSIPDFPAAPQHQVQTAPRRSANLGPPPSSRRGASSYYSNISFVSPIPEESLKSRSHGSYASSNAIPSSWGEESPGFQSFDEDQPRSGSIMEEGQMEQMRTMRIMEDEGPGLVRSASTGKRGRPRIVTMGSAERTQPHAKIQSASGIILDMKDCENIDSAGATMRTDVSPLSPSDRGKVWPVPISPLARDDGYNRSLNSSAESLPKINTTAPKAASPNVNANLAVPMTSTPAIRTKSQELRNFNPFSAIRRPPKLNIDAVREAEARGSLTSLPDLIKRATRLAAMMDNGKRPASQFDELQGFPGDEELGRIRAMQMQQQQTTLTEKHGSGLSRMLAAFPEPGATSPTANENRIRPQSTWPTASFDDNNSDAGLTPPNGEQRKTKGRRCCGLPLWGFITLVIVLLIIIAAAVVIPLKLLVLDKKASTSAGASQSDLITCQATTTCANGGTVVVSMGTCSCICANGFTGSNCTVAGADGCSTMNVTLAGGTIANVTVGSAISRLVNQAQANFSIPLNTQTIIAKFNAGNLSCGAQNALITFDGQAARLAPAVAPVEKSGAISEPVIILTDTPIPIRRQEIPNDGFGGNVLKTTVVRQSTIIMTTVNPTAASGYYWTSTFVSLQTISSERPGAAPTPAPSQPSNPASSNTIPGATPTNSAPNSVSTAPGSFVVTQEVLDFARVVTLFVLQHQTLDAAIASQNSMQTFFSGNPAVLTAAKAGNVTLTGTSTVDFEDLSVNLGNGSVGGVANSGAGRTSLARRQLRPTRLEGRLK